jgi:hypothetical protein
MNGNLIERIGAKRYDQTESLLACFKKLESKHFMSLQELIWTIDRLGLKTEIRNAIVETYRAVIRNETLNETLSFFRYAVSRTESHEPWAPLVDGSRELQASAELLSILSSISSSIREHQRRHIDPAHAEFNLGHLKNYINDYYETHGHIGINPYGWCSFLARLSLFRLESLNFAHKIYHDPFTGFLDTKTKRLVFLADENLSIRTDGQFNGVNGIDDSNIVTTRNDDDRFYRGYAVNPKGYVTNAWLTLAKNTWVKVLKKGDPVIDFHIPSGIDYGISSIEKSFDAAKIFFKNHYSEYDYAFFWCVSWLYSPQIDRIIENPKSRIRRIAKTGYILPATPGEEALFDFIFQTRDPKGFKSETSLQRNVIGLRNHGLKINCGTYLYPFDRTMTYREVLP